MKLHELKHLLEHQGERMLELANRLSEKGEPPRPEDMELIRMAKVPLLQEHFDYLMMLHLSGKDIAPALESLSLTSG